jgi:dihydropyrimidinase
VLFHAVVETAEIVEGLHAQGVDTVCHVNAGTIAETNPGFSDLPPAVIGSPHKTRSNERYLDIRRLQMVVPVITQQIVACKNQGFTAIEPDGFDAYAEDSGFPLTAADTVRYATTLAHVAHGLGLRIAQKNVPELTEALMPHFDFAITESCFETGTCEQIAAYPKANKPAFNAEYTDADIDFAIKGGTIVTADLTWKADVADRGRDHHRDRAKPVRRRELDATGCYVMPGGIDPHTHLEMPFMGTYSTDDFESGTRAALAGGTTMVVDFACPPRARACWKPSRCGTTSRPAPLRLLLPHGDHLVGRAGLQRDGDRGAEERGINTFKHFMAYKGALMVDDDEMFASFQRCAELGAHAAGPCRERRCGGRLQAKLLAEGNNGPRGARLFPPAGSGRRGRQPRDHDRRHGGRAALHRACLLRAGARGDPPGAPEGHAGLWRAADPAPDARRKRVFQHPDWDHAARRVMSPPFRDKKHQDSLWAGLQAGSLQVVATDHCAFTTEQKRMAWAISPRSPTAPAGWRTGCRCSGPMASKPAADKDEFVAVTSTNIAKILNIYPKKGAIRVGADADIVVWDPAKKRRSPPPRSNRPSTTTSSRASMSRACRASP